uniref:Uncharacterized protein n=1 Tax=Picea glauca TaxID=3330 RepID=A0A101LUW1_PICGL|nr:hypothetical protein ABT39_MTgene2348 [Picea glauca]QHR92277.1 hypothetical protein Q903MT_gene6318 [Picea sitchensis]
MEHPHGVTFVVSPCQLNPIIVHWILPIPVPHTVAVSSLLLSKRIPNSMAGLTKLWDNKALTRTEHVNEKKAVHFYSLLPLAR